MKSTNHAFIAACMVLVALALLLEFACAHEAARVGKHLRTSSLHVSDLQLETTEAEAAPDVHHRASHAHLAREEFKTTGVPVRNCKPANKEPWQLDIRFACVFANPAGGFDYFYMLRNELFLRNCFCSSDGSSGFNIVFEDTMLGEALTSPDAEGGQCYSRANGSGAWTKYGHKSDFAYAFDQFLFKAECKA